MVRPRLHPHGGMRTTFLLLGLVCVAFAVIGVFVPLLPTTPFLLLAAACFARSSERFHQWLLNHPVFGTTVRAWDEHRSIPRKAKWVAIVSLIMTLGISIALFISNGYARLAAALVGFVVLVYLYRIPTRD